MLVRILCIIVTLLVLNNSALAGEYIGRGKRYIGETELYYCYIYESDINFVVNFTTFRNSGDWVAVAVLEPKTEKDRLRFVGYLEDEVRRGSLKTMGLPNRDNKLWAWAVRLLYKKDENKLFTEDDFYLNKYGEIIALTKVDLSECAAFDPSDPTESWQIKDLMDAYIHARYQEISASQNSVVR